MLNALAELAPRDMRRALMTAFGNARLDDHDAVRRCDLPEAANGRSRIGFLS